MTLESNILTQNGFAASRWPSHDQTVISPQLQTDHFVSGNGVEIAGTHISIDFLGASGLNDLNLMEYALRAAVEADNATLLHIYLHTLAADAGISGVVVLAEARVSVHTWPACEFAAFDIFNRGNAVPEKAISILHAAFQPRSINVSEHLRGTGIAPTRDIANFLPSTYSVSNDPFYADPKDC